MLTWIATAARRGVLLGLVAVFVAASCGRSENAPASDKPPAPRLPKAFAYGTSDDALKSTYAAASVLALSHPQYPAGIKALVSRDDDGYELAFYQRVGERYEIIDTSQVVFGCRLPSVSVEPKSGLPALRAPMREVADDAYYFFIRNGKIASEVEHPEKWITIKEPTVER